jgi:hypothetical protein
MRFIWLVALAACGTTISETRLNPTPDSARRHAPAEVEVLASAPLRAHVDVAMLIAARQTDTSEEAIAQLRARAGEIGCDAIVIAPVGKVSAGHNPDEFSATCVVYVLATAAQR